MNRIKLLVLWLKKYIGTSTWHFAIIKYLFLYADRFEDETLCPSMYSFHSSPEEKNKLLHVLTEYGVETTVDRSAKKVRIQQWIQNSVIKEENEDMPPDNEDEFSSHSQYQRYIPDSATTSSSATGDSFRSK